MPDTTEYSAARNDLRRVLNTVTPVLTSLQAAEKVLQAAQRAAQDVDLWTDLAGQKQAACQAQEEKLLEITGKVSTAQAEIEAADADTKARLAALRKSAADETALLVASVADATEKARVALQGIEENLAGKREEARAALLKLEEAHGVRVAAMNDEVSAVQARLDELNAAIEALRKRL